MSEVKGRRAMEACVEIARDQKSIGLAPPLPKEFYENLFNRASKIAQASYALRYDSNQLFSIVQYIIANRNKELGLPPSDVAILLKALNEDDASEVRAFILKKSEELRRRFFENKVAVMLPIEITSYCASSCDFCGWSVTNKLIPRFRINIKGLMTQLKWALKIGFTHIELVGGDDLNFLRHDLFDTIDAVKNYLRDVTPEIRLSLCFTPLPFQKYKLLSKMGVDAVLTWMETYNPVLYFKTISSGPKAYGLDDNLALLREKRGYTQRLYSYEDVIRSGMQVGMGIMLGLGKVEAEVLSLIMHIQALKTHYQDFMKPVIIGMPILNAKTTDSGSNIQNNSAYFDAEKNFEIIASIYLLSLPDHAAWIFSNCRVPINTQLKTLLTAGCFSSTMVRVAPGAYLPDASGTENIEQYFTNYSCKEDKLAELLNGEQFKHYYSNHTDFLDAFYEHGLEVVTDQQLFNQSTK